MLKNVWSLRRKGKHSYFLLPPMGDSLRRASKGQMLTESETPRCSFAKGSNALGNNRTSSFHNTLIHWLGGQKRRCVSKKSVRKLHSYNFSQLRLDSSTSQNHIHQHLDASIWPQDTSSSLPVSQAPHKTSCLWVLLSKCLMILDIS